VYRSSWCEVDLAQLRQNLARLKEVAGTRTLLVVKANAYGHGLVGIAREAERSGVDMLGLATIGEAEELKRAGVTAPMLIMCAMDPDEIDFCVANGVAFLAWRPDHFERAMAAADTYGVAPIVHLEVDTGMSRSGVDSGELPALLDSLTPAMRAGIAGLCSHFFAADMESTDSSEQQLKEFLECADLVERYGMNPLLHIANSPGTLRLPSSRLGMARLGIAAYGILPSQHTPLPSGVEPIMTWKAKVTNVKDIEPGRGIGYRWLFVADRTERVATLGLGYADGYHRFPEGINSLLFNGVETRVVGSVFMDQCVFLVPDGMPVQVGDEAVLLGRQGAGSITADDLAAKWGTNSYDVVSGIRNRVPRVYVG
jgi:alanine racemase